MKGSDVHALNDHDLVERLKQAREEAFSLRFRHATGELENTAGLRGARRGPGFQQAGLLDGMSVLLRCRVAGTADLVDLHCRPQLHRSHLERPNQPG